MSWSVLSEQEHDHPELKRKEPSSRAQTQWELMWEEKESWSTTFSSNYTHKAFKRNLITKSDSHCIHTNPNRPQSPQSPPPASAGLWSHLGTTHSPHVRVNVHLQHSQQPAALSLSLGAGVCLRRCVGRGEAEMWWSFPAQGYGDLHTYFGASPSYFGENTTKYKIPEAQRSPEQQHAGLSVQRRYVWTKSNCVECDVLQHLDLCDLGKKKRDKMKFIITFFTTHCIELIVYTSCTGYYVHFSNTDSFLIVSPTSPQSREIKYSWIQIWEQSWSGSSVGYSTNSTCGSLECCFHKNERHITSVCAGIYSVWCKDS